MKFVPTLSALALIGFLSACENERPAETRDTTPPRETRRDADRDTIRIGTERDNDVEIIITD